MNINKGIIALDPKIIITQTIPSLECHIRCLVTPKKSYKTCRPGKLFYKGKFGGGST